MIIVDEAKSVPEEYLSSRLPRLARIERGEPGWQGTAWALERI